jgi:release factor glutamine methyltransferase
MHAPAQSVRTWTILSLIEWGTGYLSERGFDEARLTIELLLSHLLQLKRIHLYTNFDRPLTPDELAAFKMMLQRRLTHEPVQYIIGETEFMGIPLFVNPAALIPRPETEELVERALAWIGGRAQDRIEVLDIGTGSGNIPIALERLSTRAHITSIDVSTEALQLAVRNIERHKCTRITVLHADVFSGFLPHKKFDLVIANPPYISAAEFESLQPEVRDFEPPVATTDKADGLRIVRRVCDVAADKLQGGGALFMEIAYNQSDAVGKIARSAGLDGVTIHKDLHGNDRILEGYRPA